MLAFKERQRIVDLCVDLSQRGHLAGTGGNVALRIDHHHFAVTPSATDYLAMGAADVCVVRLSDLRLVDGARAPSVETGMHARLLRLRPDVRCSIHTHQPVASAWTLMREPLRAAAGAAGGRPVPMVGYMPSGSGLLTRLVGRALRPDADAYLMRNHGVICCGASVAAAVAAVDGLEHLARQQLAERIANRAAAQPDRAFALQRVLTILEGNT